MSDVTYWSCDEDDEHLVHETWGEAVGDYLDGADIDWDDEEATVTVYGFSRLKIPPYSELFLENLLESMDETFGGPDRRTTPSEELKAAADAFYCVLVKEYQVWRCDEVVRKEINILRWIRENQPNWIEDANTDRTS